MIIEMKVFCYYHRNGYAFFQSSAGDKLRLYAGLNYQSNQWYTLRIEVKKQE